MEAIIEGGSPKRVEVEELGEGRFRVAGVEHLVDVKVLGEGVYSLLVDGRSYEVSVRDSKDGRALVEVGGHLIPVRLEDAFQASRGGFETGRGGFETRPYPGGASAGVAVIVSPMPGRIVGIKVEPGGEVREGEGVVVVEAMKMENELHAPRAGKVAKVAVKVGDAVEGGQELVVIE